LQLLGQHAVKALALLALVGCSAAHPKSASEAPAAAAPADPHAQIEALDRAITDELAQAHVAPPAPAACTGASCATAMATPFATPSVSDAACHPAASDPCREACTLSSSICANQAKICELAQQLPGDDWAATKCTGARASCQAAHDHCCSCLL
jgi:hypothetical protein